MNPWGFLIIGLGVLAVIIGVTGSYENVKGAITGKGTGTTSVPKKKGTGKPPPVQIDTPNVPPAGTRSTPEGQLV